MFFFLRPPLVLPSPSGLPSGLWRCHVSFMCFSLSRLLSALVLLIFTTSAFWLSICARRSLMAFGSPGLPAFFFISSSCRSRALIGLLTFLVLVVKPLHHGERI